MLFDDGASSIEHDPVRLSMFVPNEAALHVNAAGSVIGAGVPYGRTLRRRRSIGLVLTTAELSALQAFFDGLAGASFSWTDTQGRIWTARWLGTFEAAELATTTDGHHGVRVDLALEAIADDTGRTAYTNADASQMSIRRGAAGLDENLIKFSEQFNSAPWGGAGYSINADSAVAPDGTTTMDKFVESALTEPRFIVQLLPTASDNTYYCASVVAKAAERQWAVLTIRRKDTVYRANWFDLSNGVAGSNNKSKFYGIIDLGDGYYRCWAADDVLSGGISPQFLISTALSDGGASGYAGDGSSGIYLWGAQFNRGEYPGTYTPTTSAAVNSSLDFYRTLFFPLAYQAPLDKLRIPAAAHVDTGQIVSIDANRRTPRIDRTLSFSGLPDDFILELEDYFVSTLIGGTHPFTVAHFRDADLSARWVDSFAFEMGDGLLWDGRIGLREEV